LSTLKSSVSEFLAITLIPAAMALGFDLLVSVYFQVRLVLQSG